MELTSPPEVQSLRECVDPPIILPFPEAVDSERLSGLIEFYRDRLAEAGFRLEPCEHLSEREMLQWIYRLLQEEVPVDPRARANVLMNVETCPDCWRWAIEKEVEAPLKETEAMMKRARTRLVETKQALEEDERFQGGIAWPPGVQRFVELVETLLDRLEADITEDRIQLLAGSAREAYRVMAGLESLLWLLSGLRFMVEENRFRAYDCLVGGTRMARILAQKPPDDHPGRLYRDLGLLVPDAELYTNIAHNEWREREELIPQPPPENCIDEQAWANFFYTESSFNEPFFKDLLESEPSEERLKTLHTNWKQRQLSIKLVNKRDEALSKQVLLQTRKYDPDCPAAFFNRDYSYLEFFRQELEDMDAEEASLAVVLAQMEAPDEPVASDSIPEFEPPEEQEMEEMSSLEAQLKKLKEQLIEAFDVETYDDVDPLSVVLIFLVDLALDWLDFYPTYFELSNNNSPERGAYLLTAECAGTAREWLELTGDNTYCEEFKQVEELARKHLVTTKNNK